MTSVTVLREGDERVPLGYLNSIHPFSHGYVQRYEKAHPEKTNAANT